MLPDPHTLVNFLNHGTTPFVGRKRAVEEIVEFHNEGGVAERLRTMLVTAEAGMGKSRLIEETLPHIQDGTGIALHVKLVPEAEASIVPLLARTLSSNRTARRILQQRQVTEDISSLLPALRTLARLRPLLVVLEDLHLLHARSLGEVATLLDHLADEPLGLLAVGRPVDSPALGLLEPSLYRHTELPPLSVDDVALLWSSLFSVPPPSSTFAATLHDVSHGSPLALRTILREGVAVGAIVLGKGDEETIHVDISRLVQSGRASTLRIGRGMTAALTAEEREAVIALSLLGESFSREAGVAILSRNGEETLDRLLYRGVLHPLRTVVSPLAGLDRETIDFPATKAPLLGFTHTLLHQYCLDSAIRRRTALHRPLAADAPLYSLTPITAFLHAVAAGEVEEQGTIYPALLRCANALHEIILSTGWSERRERVELLEKAVEAAKSSLDPEQYLDLSVSTLYKRAIIAESEGQEKVWEELLNEALGRTAAPASAVGARLRIGAIAKDPSAQWQDGAFCRRALGEIETIAHTYPDVRNCLDYRQFMCLIGVIGTINNDLELVGHAERYYENARATTGRPRVQEMLDTWFLPVLIQTFTTPAQLEKRRAQFQIVEQMPKGGSAAVHIADHTLMFLYATGEFDALLRRTEESRELFLLRNVEQLYVRARVRKLVALGGIGVRMEELDREFQSILDEKILPDYTSVHLHTELVHTLWMRGDDRWRTTALNLPSLKDLHPALCALLAVEKGEAEMPEEDALLPTRPILCLNDLIACTASLAMGQKSGSFPASRMLRTAFAECVEWCSKRRLAGFLDGVVTMATGWVEERSVKEWRSLAEQVRRDRNTTPTDESDGRITLSMLETIEVQTGTSHPHKVSGARMKTVLALMVANTTAKAALTLEEFALLVAGDERTDPEAARNNLYVRLHSLRKLLGHDAILSAPGEAPHLNEDRVRVDLIDVQNRLRTVRSLQSTGKLGKATMLLRTVLYEVRTAVPYPGLYDDFFDAARNDYDVALRSTILLLAEELAWEGDHEGVAALLQPALERTPDDEEFAEVLCRSFTALGHKSQAEWVRRTLARALANGYDSSNYWVR